MSPTSSRDKILEKIALLSNMRGTNSGAFQGEINNAASLIQALMDKYSISQQEVDTARREKETAEVREEFKEKSSEYRIQGLTQWHWKLAEIIARITHTKEYFGTHKRRGTAKFFGSERNVEIAATLFAEWVQIIMAMCESAIDDHWKYLIKKYDYHGFLAAKKAMGFGREHSFMDVVVPPEERTTHFKSSWYSGCLNGIATALNEQERKREQEATSALVLYHENLDLQYSQFSRAIRMKTAKVHQPKAFSSIGYEQGYETGKKIRIGSEKIGN